MKITAEILRMASGGPEGGGVEALGRGNPPALYFPRSCVLFFLAIKNVAETGRVLSVLLSDISLEAYYFKLLLKNKLIDI
jgi:hypothetical protein